MRLLLVILLLAGSLAAQSPPEGYVRAVELHQAGKLEAAVDAYREYLSTDPGRPEALTNLGAALASLGRYDESLAAYDGALAKLPDHPGIRRNRALALYKSGRVSGAAEEFETLLETSPEDVALATLAADCHAILGRESEVIRLLEPLSDTPEFGLAPTYLLAKALVREGRVAEGEALAQSLLGGQPKAETHVILGLTFIEAGEFTAAQSEFERALALNPKLAGVQSHLGKTLLELNDAEAAVEAFRAELAHNPHDFDAHFFLGVQLRQQGDIPDAIGHFRQALRLRPEAHEATYQLALAQIAAKDYDPARETLEALVAEVPGFPEAHVSLATVYYRLGRREDAERHRQIARDANR